MPQVRKLTDQEVNQLNNKGKGTRKLVEEEYDAILSDYGVGDYGEAMLAPGENRLTVRNRLKAAAKRRELGIDFRRTNSDMIRFKIVANGNGRVVAAVEVPAAEPEPEPAPAPPKRKGGRPKKNP
jgi:hypothetical protein